MLETNQRDTKHPEQHISWRQTCFPAVMLSANAPYLGAPHTDDPVHIARGIVKIGDSQGVFAGGDPVSFGSRVNLENMGSGAEDWLLPATEMNRAVRAEGKLSNGGRGLTFWHLHCVMHPQWHFCYLPPI